MAPIIRLARSLETLPRRDELPKEFEAFLDTRERRSGYQLLIVLLTAIIALGTVLTGLSEEMRRVAIDLMTKFVATNLLNIVTAISFIATIIAVAYTVTYAVPVSALRKYWPRDE